MKFRTLISLIFVSLIVIIIAACTRKDYPVIDGYLTKVVYYAGDTIWDRYFEVFDDDGLPMVPQVKLNGEQVEIDDFYYRLCVYQDTVHFATGKKYDLTVDVDQGQASASINMPGEFSMISPGPTYILNRDSVLTVYWHKSDKATWYWFSVYLDYDFLDSLGEWDSYEFYHDTILYDTVVRYPRNFFIPGNVQTIIEGEAEAGTWALDGPNRWEPGTKGNIRGQGLGYFSATYQPRELDFYVGGPPKSPKLGNSSKVWDHLRERIKQFRKTP